VKGGGYRLLERSETKDPGTGGRSGNWAARVGSDAAGVEHETRTVVAREEEVFRFGMRRERSEERKDPTRRTTRRKVERMVHLGWIRRLERGRDRMEIEREVDSKWRRRAVVVASKRILLLLPPSSTSLLLRTFLLLLQVRMHPIFLWTTRSFQGSTQFQLQRRRGSSTTLR